jgi:hypothetical protein
VRVITKRACGFRTYRAVEVALYHILGRLPEPEAEALLGCRVDVATERSLHPLIRERMRAEALPL